MSLQETATSKELGLSRAEATVRSLREDVSKREQVTETLENKLAAEKAAHEKTLQDNKELGGAIEMNEKSLPESDTKAHSLGDKIVKRDGVIRNLQEKLAAETTWGRKMCESSTSLEKAMESEKH